MSKALQERDGRLSYLDKEMLLMTNILYYGVANMLNDPIQILFLHKSFILLLEKLRFGDDDSSQYRGILGYNELLALILCIEGCGGCNEDLPSRSTRSWTVRIPMYETYKSTTEAYISFLPLVHGNLQSQEEAKLARQVSVGASATRLAQLCRFERKLADLLLTLSPPTPEDRTAIAYMQHFVHVHKIKEQSTSKTNRLDIIIAEGKLNPILDYIDQSLSQSSAMVESIATSSCSPGQDSPALRYSHYSGYLLERIIGWTHSEEIRRRAVALMRKWPYREGDKYSYTSAIFYEAVVEHDLTGPQRTRASQLAGNPILPAYENGGLVDRIFDGTRECECVRGLFVCSDHKLESLRVQIKSEPRYFALASRYEARYNLGFTRYYLDKVVPHEEKDGNEQEMEYVALDYVG